MVRVLLLLVLIINGVAPRIVRHRNYIHLFFVQVCFIWLELHFLADDPSNTQNFHGGQSFYVYQPQLVLKLAKVNIIIKIFK